MRGSVTDSLTDTIHLQKRAARSYRVTARIHSVGVFGYGGMIANENPSFDLNFTYAGKHWGGFFLKAIDLYDLHSGYNFSLAMVNKPFHLSRQFSFTPYAGFVIEQTEKICGADSDGMVFLITSFKSNGGITIEHCARFSNTFFETEFFDWLNRLRILYSYRHVDMSATAWHNNNVFDHNKHTSFGFSVAYSRIKVSDHVTLSSSLTAIKMTANTNAEELAQASGLSLSIAAVFE
jgi:hypothetical protein